MAERQYMRRKVLWDVNMWREKGDPIRCQLVDISAAGAKIRTEMRIPLGATVVIIGDRGVAFSGKIAWHDLMYTGISFLEDPSIIEQRIAELMSARLQSAE